MTAWWPAVGHAHWRSPVLLSLAASAVVLVRSDSTCSHKWTPSEPVTTTFVSSSVNVSVILISTVSVNCHSVFNGIEKILDGQSDTDALGIQQDWGYSSHHHREDSFHPLGSSKKSLLQKYVNGFVLTTRLWKKDAVRDDWAVNMNKTDLSSPNLRI